MKRQRGNEDFESDHPTTTSSSTPRSNGPTSRLPIAGGTPGEGQADGNGDAGMVALSYILAGVLFYGGLGWLVARWLGHPWIIAVGLMIGLAASMYLIIKRFGGTWR